jgi:methyl-accepting chemotaxis protein
LKFVMEALAHNDLTVDVPGIERRDELGEIARTVEVFKKNGLEAERMKADQQATELGAARQRKAEMIKMANDFVGLVSGSLRGTIAVQRRQPPQA